MPPVWNGISYGSQKLDLDQRFLFSNLKSNFGYLNMIERGRSDFWARTIFYEYFYNTKRVLQYYITNKIFIYLSI